MAARRHEDARVRDSAAAVRDHRPIYVQLAETLRARILSGYYADRIEGELILAREWQVSRRTVQQAIEILVREGLLGRRQGTGTFVNHQGVARRYRAITSITDGLRAQGLAVTYRVLASGPQPAPDEARAFFAIADGAPLYRHVRLILGDERPAAVAETWLDPARIAGLDLSHLDTGLYDTLRRRFGRTVVHAEDSYRPALADAATAGLLQVPENSAIHVATRRAFDQSGEPIELSQIALMPVPLEISIAQVGAARRDAAANEPWNYRIGFGAFRKPA